MQSQVYNSNFFASQSSGSINSAREVLKIVKDLIQPESVVDIGCGLGTWLKAWLELGVTEVLGVDGDYVKKDRLLIPRSRFRAMDLSAPTAIDAQFDLVQSLEVAEHLPERVADTFVSFLCSLGSVILFGAAIPFQGGTNHVNEQWPEYWADKFSARGFVTVDAIRGCIWHNPNVDLWYRQNTLIFVRPDRHRMLDGLRGQPVVPPQGSLSKVHPGLWLEKNETPLHLEEYFKMLPKSVFDIARRGSRRLKRSFAQ
jgi:SAM-dependent methyltransferase